MTHPVQTLLSLLVMAVMLARLAPRRVPKQRCRKRAPKHLRPYDDLRLTNL